MGGCVGGLGGLGGGGREADLLQPGQEPATAKKISLDAFCFTLKGSHRSSAAALNSLKGT